MDPKRIYFDPVNGFAHRRAQVLLTKSELTHIHNELDFTKRFQDRYIDLFDQNLFPPNDILKKQYNSIINVLLRMKGRNQHAIPHMDTLQLHLQTATDVAEYMEATSTFSKLRMRLIRQNGLENDRIKSNASPGKNYIHWSEDQHALDVMILDLKYVIQHIIHVSANRENRGLSFIRRKQSAQNRREELFSGPLFE